MAMYLQALACGQCGEALQLARRFDASFDQAFEAIAQVET